MLKNSKHVEFNDKSFHKVLFIETKCYPARTEHSTAKSYVNHSIDELTLVKNIDNKNCNYQCSSSKSQNTPNSEPDDDNYVTTKSYVDSLTENDRKRQDLSTKFNN